MIEDTDTGFIDKVGEPIHFGDTIQIRSSEGETSLYVIALRDDEPAICVHGAQDDQALPGIRLTQPIAKQVLVVAKA